MGVCRICQGGANYFCLEGGGGLTTRGVALRLLGGSGACLPENFF